MHWLGRHRLLVIAGICTVCAAIAILGRVVADSERLLGDEHPDTLTARSNLAFSYWQAGRDQSVDPPMSDT